MKRMIDLRSDTVTRPTDEMRKAMDAAEVGDDVFGEDPTAIRLEQTVAEGLGFEAALFMPTGVMANEVAIRLWTRPGDEVLCDAHSHVVDYELSGMAVLSGVIPRTVVTERGHVIRLPPKPKWSAHTASSLQYRKGWECPTPAPTIAAS